MLFGKHPVFTFIIQPRRPFPSHIIENQRSNEGYKHKISPDRFLSLIAVMDYL